MWQSRAYFPLQALCSIPRLIQYTLGSGWPASAVACVVAGLGGCHGTCAGVGVQCLCQVVCAVGCCQVLRPGTRCLQVHLQLVIRCEQDALLVLQLRRMCVLCYHCPFTPCTVTIRCMCIMQPMLLMCMRVLTRAAVHTLCEPPCVLDRPNVQLGCLWQ